MGMMLVGHEQVKRVGVGGCGPTPRRSRVPKIESRRECASSRLAFTQCAQMGETENVSQQECSTGHRPRLAKQAALNAATDNGETAVRQKLSFKQKTILAVCSMTSRIFPLCWALPASRV